MPWPLAQAPRASRITTLRIPPVVKMTNLRKTRRVRPCSLSSRKEDHVSVSRVLQVCSLTLFAPGCSAPPEMCGNPGADPDCAAWSTFAAINRPARNGTPDLEWETWIEARDV